MPDAADWQILDSDREFFARELDSFVPQRVFDAHAHLYDMDHFNGDLPVATRTGPRRATMAEFLSRIDQIHPGRQCDGLFFGFPKIGSDMEAANRFLAAEVRTRPQSRAQMLIEPAMDPEYIRETVKREGFVGLKCYHVYSVSKPTFESPVQDFLPEPHVRLAHEEGLSITLHMVRARAMADPLNQEIIRAWALKYPNMKWILAHAARGFNPHHTIEGIGALKGLRNVWCDTSAVTDSGAFEAIVRTLGVDRLMYGADFPISHLRGRCIAIGDTFHWLSRDNTKFEANYADMTPGLIGHESLRTLKLACWNLRLKDSEVEAIFFDNARQLFSL